jgi:uncharacterized membrane protein
MGFHDMMSGWGAGWAWTMYLGMIAFWIGVVALVIFGIKAAVTTSGTGTAAVMPQAVNQTPLDVLRTRYANGEIDAAEYQQKKADLM